MEDKIVIEKDGKEVECEILFTFDCEQNGKSYVGYTDHQYDEQNRENIYISSFDPILGLTSFEEVTSKEELAMVDDVLQQVRKSVKEGK